MSRRDICCPEERRKEMSKKMFKFQDNKFYRANRAAAKKVLGRGEDEDKRASEGK